MLVIWRADVYRINVIAFDQLAPVGFMTLKAPLLGEGFGAILGAAANSFEHRAIAEVWEKVANALIAV